MYGDAMVKKDKAEDRLTEESFTEFSWVVPFNLLANPNASFRNLALNTGFVRLLCFVTTAGIAIQIRRSHSN